MTTREKMNLVLLQMADEYDISDDSPERGKFKYSSLVCMDRSSRALYYLRAKCEGESVLDFDVAALEASLRNNTHIADGELNGPKLLIDPTEAYLQYTPGFLIKKPPFSGVFVKDDRLTAYGDVAAFKEWQDYHKCELEFFEMLRGKLEPDGKWHPSIACYLGCVVEDVLKNAAGAEDLRIVGIAMEEYKCTLEERVNDPERPPLNVDKVIEDVTKALQYMHHLDYCHNDVNPFNIMLRDDDSAVLIDFDSCQLMGEQLKKGTTDAWGVGDTISANKESHPNTDWFGLKKVRDYLQGKGNPELPRVPPAGCGSASG